MGKRPPFNIKLFLKGYVIPLNFSAVADPVVDWLETILI